MENNDTRSCALHTWTFLSKWYTDLLLWHHFTKALCKTYAQRLDLTAILSLLFQSNWTSFFVRFCSYCCVYLFDKISCFKCIKTSGNCVTLRFAYVLWFNGTRWLNWTNTYWGVDCHLVESSHVLRSEVPEGLDCYIGM